VGVLPGGRVGASVGVVADMGVGRVMGQRVSQSSESTQQYSPLEPSHPQKATEPPSPRESPFESIHRAAESDH